MTDLILVNPGNLKKVYGELRNKFAGIEPPYWCALIASFVREKGYSVKIIDADAENLSPEETVSKIIENEPLLVNIVVMGTNPSASSTPKMATVSKILTNLKEKYSDIKIMLSGLHPSSLPEKTLKEEKTDYVCQGEGFLTTLNLLKAIKEKRNIEKENIKGLWYKKDKEIINGGYEEIISNLDDLPLPAWDLLPMEKYRAHNWHCFENIEERGNYAVIYTSFGCPFNCSYCNIKALYNNKPGIRYKSPERVIEEIDELVEKYNIKNLKIADELFVLNKERVHKICDYIIERKYKLNIWAYARIDTVDEEILKKLKKAGFNWLCYGIESASEKVRKGVSKKIHQDRIEKVIEMTKKSGIYVLGNFIFGLPDDDYETMNQTLNLAKKLKCEYVNFYVGMAYPGSYLYEWALKNEIKLPESWTGFAQLSEDTLPLPTKYLKPEEVLKFRDKAFYEYYSDPEYLKMIEEKFGKKVVEHIEEMLKIKISRKYG
ncbi:MAG: B12-binding domain-containing radical SAM protein [bacterium]|nr:B12-binding domain-containing radical SAM protein [bacterium]